MKNNEIEILEVGSNLLGCILKDRLPVETTKSIIKSFDKWFIGTYRNLPERHIRSLRYLRQKALSSLR